jgi:hypothetical protein
MGQNPAETAGLTVNKKTPPECFRIPAVVVIGKGKRYRFAG